jgi:hypothetical protein
MSRQWLWRIYRERRLRRAKRVDRRGRIRDFLLPGLVLPADVVAGLGEGNTLAGAKIWHKVFRR